MPCHHIVSPKGYKGLCKKDLYVVALLRTLQAGIENTNQLLKNPSRLLRKNLSSFIQVSTELTFFLSSLDGSLSS